MQRLLQKDAAGKALLFFGSRRRDQDYLYGSLLEDWNKKGIIQLHTAFSREKVRSLALHSIFLLSADELQQATKPRLKSMPRPYRLEQNLSYPSYSRIEIENQLLSGEIYTACPH